MATWAITETKTETACYLVTAATKDEALAKFYEHHDTEMVGYDVSERTAHDTICRVGVLVKKPVIGDVDETMDRCRQ